MLFLSTEDPSPNHSCSVELGPNNVYALERFGTTPISTYCTSRIQGHHGFSRNSPSNHSYALELDVSDPARIAAALLSIQSVSADSTRGPREREIVRVAMNWPAPPLLIHPESIEADG